MSQSHISSTKGSTPRRLNVNRYIEGLKGEFESMAQEIESLRKERDGYKAKVEAQVNRLQDVRRNFVCERCGKGSASAPPKTLRTAISTSSTLVPLSKSSERPGKSGSTRGVDPSLPRASRRTPQGPAHALPIITSSQLKTSRSAVSASSSSRPVLLSEEPGKSGTFRGADPTLQGASRETLQRPHSVIQTAQPQTASHTVTQASGPPPSVLIVGPDSAKEHNQSIIFNNEVKKELDVEMERVFFHGDTIGCVKFSRDGRYLAAGCADGKAYIYDVETGTLTCVLRNLLAENDGVYTLCFSHDGNYLAANSSDREIYIWEIKSKFVRNSFKGHTLSINSLDFSPNGRMLAAASGDNTVCLWNMRGGAAMVLTDADSVEMGYFTSAVFSPDGRYVAGSNSDGIARIWDARAGQLLRRVKSQVDKLIYNVAFIPSGKGLVTAGVNGSLYWDLRSLYTTRCDARTRTVEEQTQPERVFLGHLLWTSFLSISPDGRWVASSSEEQGVRIWATLNDATQCSLKHDEISMVLNADFNPAGRFLASGDSSGEVKIWRYSYIGGA